MGIINKKQQNINRIICLNKPLILFWKYSDLFMSKYIASYNVLCIKRNTVKGIYSRKSCTSVTLRNRYVSQE